MRKKKLLSVESMFEDDNFIVKAASGLILNEQVKTVT